jgi:hypothetical protein
MAKGFTNNPSLFGVNPVANMAYAAAVKAGYPTRAQIAAIANVGMSPSGFGPNGVSGGMDSVDASTGIGAGIAGETPGGIAGMSSANTGGMGGPSGTGGTSGDTGGGNAAGPGGQGGPGDPSGSPGGPGAASAGTGGDSGGGGSACYITTAAIEHAGERDDGPVLGALRWFRDSVMMESPEGQMEVAAYYRDAPAIVAALNRRRDAGTVYRHLMDEWIRPAAKAINDGDYDQARALYAGLIDDAARSARRGSAPTIVGASTVLERAAERVSAGSRR